MKNILFFNFLENEDYFVFYLFSDRLDPRLSEGVTEECCGF